MINHLTLANPLQRKNTFAVLNESFSKDSKRELEIKCHLWQNAKSNGERMNWQLVDPDGRSIKPFEVHCIGIVRIAWKLMKNSNAKL